MKKILLFAVFVFVSIAASAQPNEDPALKSYTASNGVTYKIKDTVRLGMGSAPSGNFRFLTMGGWMASPDGVGKIYSNTAVVIKKIKKGKIKGIEKFWFAVGGGNITNYNLYIEDAIMACEVTPCSNAATPAASSGSDKFDKLKKLKDLLDSGVLTKDEYEIEKKKLLN